MPSMGDDFRVATYGPEFTHAIRPDHVIAGTVMDAVTGKPIPGVTVAGTTSDLEGRFSSSAWHDKVESVTNADGRFRLRGLGKKKKRFLHFKGSDSAPYLDRLVEVKDTVSYDPAVADVKLQPAFVVEGRLINEATKKPVNGEVHWLPLSGKQPEKQLAYGVLYFGIIDARPSGTHAVAAADGRFRLRVPREPGVILARANQFDPTALFTPTHVRDADRRFLQKKDKNPDVIEAGPIRDRDDEEYFDTMQTNWPIRWENGYAIVIPDSKATSIAVEIGFNPGATVTLNVTDEHGKPLSGVTLVGPGPYGVYPPTFAKPEIAVGGIDPKGRPVQLYLLHRERRLCAEVVVKGDEKGPIALSMRPCATVTGHVVDHSGKPVKDARVMFQMVDAVANDYVSQKLFRGNSEVRTDAGGKFSFSNMFPEQELDLFVNLPGFRSGAAPSKRVLMKPGETRDAGEFRLLDPKKRDEE
jgi:5-hydroxyisourate hydrolase-like protein (transthyretin family)